MHAHPPNAALSNPFRIRFKAYSVTKHSKNHSQYFFFCISALLFLQLPNKSKLLFRSTVFRLEKLVKDLSAQVASQPNWNPNVTAPNASGAAAANRLSLAGGPITDL